IMARSRDRWGDDRDGTDDRPRRDRGGGSPVTVVLLVVGGLFVAGVLACGGLMWLGYRKADEVRVTAMEEARRAEAAEREAFQERLRQAEFRGPGDVADPDGVPPPKPASGPAPDPPPQPPAAAFASDQAGDPARWRVLFRSKNPALWNTFTNTPADFALPLQSAPPDTRYLRLRRMGTGEALVIPMTRDRLGGADPPGRTVRW